MSMVDPGNSSATSPAAAQEREESLQVADGVVRREHTARSAEGDEDRESVIEDVAGRHYVWAAKLTQVVWFLVGITDILIGIRVILKLLGADPDSGFAAFIYGTSAPFAAPFLGVVGSPRYGDSVLEFPAMIAMLVYLLLGWLIVQAIWLVLDRPSTGGQVSRYHRWVH